MNHRHIITIMMLSVLFLFPKEVKAAPYTVTFKDWEGNIISQEDYNEGDTIIIPEGPVKPATEMYKYFFSGWDPLPCSVCTGSVTYEPVYIQDYMRYTVRIADHFGGYFRKSYGIYNSEAVMLADIDKTFDMDMIISRDQVSSDNMNGKSLWCDFRACVYCGLIENYDPTKQYMCTGFKSSIDGQILKVSDFKHYRIRGDEDYIPVYEPVESTGTNHMWFVNQFDPDDPERVLDYTEINLGNTVLEWDIYEMYETQPILKFPFPEAIVGIDGNTYYLDPYRARLYIGDELYEYKVSRIFLSHRFGQTDWNHEGSYVLPIYSSSPDFAPPDDYDGAIWISMQLYDDEYNQNGTWESGYIIPGETYVTAPENPGVDVAHSGHIDRVFSGKYNVKLSYMSGPIFATINAGESFTADELWGLYAGGAIMLEPIWEEVETAHIEYLDHDGTVLRNYYGPYYVEADQPPDPVRPNTDDYDYEFVGWKNVDTGDILTDTTVETDGRLKARHIYEAVYTETFKPRASFFVEVPASFALTESDGKYVNGMFDHLTVQIETNSDNFYVDVVPDPAVTLTGDTMGDTVNVSASMEKTRFKAAYDFNGDLSPLVRHYEPVCLEGDFSGAFADTYSGTCQFTITSGYE